MPLTAADSALRAAPPAAIGRFTPLRVLGRGAQGVVYLARDPDLDREVAIKTLARGGRDPEQLLAEARRVGRLQHPNIVALYEIGMHEDLPYLVYQYVEGRSLKELLAGGEPLPVRQALDVVVGALAAMGYAHGLGVVHRDLSPANILVDASGAPRILDFGVAGVVGTAANTSEVVGSVNYLAPESLRGAPVGPAADLFALAAVLYEMLTGTPPFAAENHMAVMYKIAHERPLPPSKVNRALDAGLDALVMKALAKEPAERYPSAEDMRAAIESWRAPQDVGDKASAAGTRNAAVQFLLRRMRRNPDFPAVSRHVTEISRKASSGSTSHANELANVILKHYALTGKLLRLVNSALYGQYGGAISTVSRAVLILGYEQVRLAALSLALFEHLRDAVQADALKDAVCGAFLSGMLARALAARERGVDVEEACIAAMFHRVGKLLIIYYFPEEHAEISALMRNRGLAEGDAVRSVLGVSYAELGAAIGREWKLPETLIGAMRVPAPGRVVAHDTHAGRLARIAAFANELGDALGGEDPGPAVAAVLERYGDGQALPGREATALAETALEELREYARVLEMDIASSPFLHRVAAACARKTAPAGPEPAHEPPADDGAPAARRAVLVDAITDITAALVNGCALNDLFVMVLEALYRGLAFERVVFCARDPRRGLVAARYGFGAGVDALIPRLRFTPTAGDDVFSVAVREGRECIIVDVSAAAHCQVIPQWCLDLAAPRALALLPVVANRVTVALVYADASRPVALAAEDLRLTRTLVNQAALAVTHGGRH